MRRHPSRKFTGVFLPSLFSSLAILLISSELLLAEDWSVTDSNSFKTAIENATSGDTISIDSSFTMSEQVSIIHGNPALTIDGNGNSIDGDNQFRPFFVESGNVSISDLTITNATAKGGDGGLGGAGGGMGAGGAIFVDDGAQISLTNVHFQSNSAQGGNGGQGDTDPSGQLGGAGGGGLGGNGGILRETAAGGGGLYGNGGDGGFANNGGAGGGGVDGDGQTPIVGGGLGSQNTGAGTVGQDGGFGGGGSGSVFRDNVRPDAGNGGFGGGGGGGDLGIDGGNGGDFGGGGGGSFGGDGGNGGFGAGGGQGGSNIPNVGGSGGDGGFGGGGGAAGPSFGSALVGQAGIGQGGGGNGGANSGTSGGGGGAAYGGAVFVRDGGTLIINGGTFNGGSVAAGLGGGNGATDGVAAGNGLYLHDNANVTFDIDAAIAGSVADSISGTGGITKSGTGTLSLDGVHTYSGATTVDGGRLNVSGSITSQTTVLIGGVLGGNGTINANVTNHGTLAPGNSIGVTTINGDFATDGTIEVEINPSANPVAGVNNDLVQVQGTATIDGNVSVKGDPTADPESYHEGAEYTFLEADTFNGTFATVTDDLAFFDVALGYDGNSAFFTLTEASVDFEMLAVTKNQLAIAQQLDQFAQSGGATLATIAGAFAPLSTAQAQAAMQSMNTSIANAANGQTHLTGLGIQSTVGGLRQVLGARPVAQSRSYASHSYSSSAPTAAVETDSPFALVSYSAPTQSSTCDGTCQSSEFQSSCSCCSKNRRRFWTSGWGLGGVANSDGNAAETNIGLGGVTLGLEQIVNASTRVGLFGSYVGSRFSDVNQVSRVNGGNVGVYLGRTAGRSYGILLGGFQFDGYESSRNSQVGALSATANGDTNGYQGFAYAERGLNVCLGSALFQPFGGLQFVHAHMNRFTETGAGALNLDVGSIDTNSVRTLLGGRIQFSPIKTRQCKYITPDIRAIWMHELNDAVSTVNTQFAGLGSTGFGTDSLNVGRDWGVLGGGFAMQTLNGWQLRADYNAQFSDRQVLHAGSGTLSYSW